MIVAFTVPGPPVPCARARVVKGHAYTEPRTAAYKRHVRACAMAAFSRAGRWPLDARYRVTLGFWVADARARDLDNLAKGTLDSLKGLAWNDDSQVWGLALDKTIDRANPRAVVQVEVMA